MTRGLRSRPLIEPVEDDVPVAVLQRTNNPLEPYQWQPGQSGNPNGRPPLSLKAALRRVMDPDELARRIWKDCQRDDSLGADARFRVFEHFEGKPKQSVDVSADEGSISLLERLTLAIEAASRGEPVPPALLPPATTE